MGIITEKRKGEGEHRIEKGKYSRKERGKGRAEKREGQRNVQKEIELVGD